MGRADGLDWLATALVALAAFFCIGNGLAMLLAPIEWYARMPGVALTGPPNQHFIRDTGFAYIASGVLLGVAAWDLRSRWPMVLAGVFWLVGHAGVHVWELTTGVCAPGQFLRDAPGVLGPPLLALTGLAIVAARARISPAGLPAAIVIPAIERAAGEPDSYVRDIGRAPGRALPKFLGFMHAAAHRHAASAELFHAARIGSVMTDDCGGCTLAAGRLAVSDGVPHAQINDWLAGRLGDDDASLAYRFGAAISSANPNVNALGDAIEVAHGRAVRTELAMGAALVRGFSGTRRGLGMAESCAITRLAI